ncbi:transposase [Desulfonatronovibrio magnus]|uniref:transposase n=1 Tax=Desulfonatronovibrio magnus TaxID=698827 RepID=UPI0005EB7804|nr:transposase [Desulfonatronovibrio magnus]
MPRNARFTLPDRPAIYHIISRTALPGFPLGDIEKDKLLDIIRYFSNIYFVDILGFSIMGNHWHLAVKVYPHEYADRDEVKERFARRYGEDVHFGDQDMEKFSKKWTDLSEFVREIKQTFSRYYNKRHNRRGFFWGERFKSMIVQEGHTLVNMLAYIDLNPIRAGIVKKPEDYRWCSLGYHTQTGNRDNLLSIDFGMKEWNEFDPKEIIRKYRQFVYETGAVDAGKGKVMDKKIVEKARKKGYKISRAERFRYRCRYFTDSGVIGGKDFVQEVFDQVKHLLRSKDERKFTPVGGVEGLYSMKRLGSS